MIRKEKHSLSVGVLFAIFAAILIAGTLIIFTAVKQNSTVEETPIATITTPDFLELSRTDAETAVTSYGLRVGRIITENVVDPESVGLVMRQSPYPGTDIPKGSSVNLVVGIGGKPLPPGTCNVRILVDIIEAEDLRPIAGAANLKCDGDRASITVSTGPTQKVLVLDYSFRLVDGEWQIER